MSLCLPIVLCIIPYFILRVSNKDITFDSYYSILKTTLTKIPIGKLLHLNSMSLGSQLWITTTENDNFFKKYDNVYYYSVAFKHQRNGSLVT